MNETRTTRIVTGFLMVMLALGLMGLGGMALFKNSAPAPEKPLLPSFQVEPPQSIAPDTTPILSQAIVTPQAISAGPPQTLPTPLGAQLSEPPQSDGDLIPGSTPQRAQNVATAISQATSQAVSGSLAPIAVGQGPPAMGGGGPGPFPTPTEITDTGGGPGPLTTAVAVETGSQENPLPISPATGADDLGPGPGSGPASTPVPPRPGQPTAKPAAINTPKPAIGLGQPQQPSSPPTPTRVTVKATPKPKPGVVVLPNGVIYGERKPNLSNRIVRIASPNVRLDTAVYEVYSPKGAWEVAEYAGGHHYNSKNPGEGGNIVIAGHNNWRGEVFRYVADLKPGNLIKVWTLDGKERHYKVESVKKLKEAGVPYAQRLENAKAMDPTASEQLTLITCWPYTTFTHRVIVVAKPLP